MRMVATQALTYAGRALKPGDTFETTRPRDHILLKGIRKATPAPVDDLFDADDEDETAGKAPRKAGTYARRDMRASK